MHLLDVAFNIEWEVEQKLEALQDIKCVPRGVSFVFPTQDLLKESVCSITCPYEE